MKKHLLATSLASAVVVATLHASAGAHDVGQPEVRIDPASLPYVRLLDERFQSYNVEMAELTGGTFWAPFDQLKTRTPGAELGASDGAAMALRPPIDLTNPRLRALTAALGPAHVRVSGTWANATYFQDNNRPKLAQPPKGYRAVLTRPQWKGLVEFAKAVDAKILTSFADVPDVRDARGVWTPVQARALIRYTRSLGSEINAVELHNEVNVRELNGRRLSDENVTGYLRDQAVLKAFLKREAPEVKLAGYGGVFTPFSLEQVRDYSERFFSSTPRPEYDIVSYHFYGALSPRCAEPDTPRGINVNQALSEEWLGRTDISFDIHKRFRDRYAPGAPIWITESAQAACGGSQWSAYFIDTFRYLDQMGRLAKRGADVIFHNTLAASDYALIDDDTHEPQPSYWAALLWRRLMGDVVLDAGPIRPGFHVYAHCQRNTPGGVTLLAVNNGDQAGTLDIGARRANAYTLSARNLQSKDVLLNGRAPSVGPDNRVPELTPAAVNGPTVRVAARTISFVTVPDAGNIACR
jgi:heparanase